METHVPEEPLVRLTFSRFLDALENGDFAEAAKQQAKLADLGWYVSKQPLRSRRRTVRSS